jgi:Lamin Tail Domain
MNRTSLSLSFPRQYARGTCGLASAIALAMVAACGGGGGGGGGAASSAGDSGGTVTTTGCTASAKASTGLIISEVSTNSGAAVGPWFEVYNASTEAIALSAYTLRTGSSTDVGDAQTALTSFQLPGVTIPAGGYLVIAAKTASVTNPVNAQGVVYVANAGRFPHWDGNGFIELVKDGATQDAVRFGSSTATPSSACAWVDSNIAALPSSSEDFGRSIVRLQSTIGTNSHTAADWTKVPFTTPGGPNDVPALAVDADNDGIPDSAEVEGGRYAGINLYSMGARAGKADIFMQIDYMDAATSGSWVGQESAWTPRRRALDMVVNAFANNGIAMHFDVGAALGDALGTGYNLGYGTKVPFADCIFFPSDQAPDSGCVSATYRKTETMPVARRNIFHYGLMAARNTLNVAGQAEFQGNDLALTLGGQLLGGSETYVGNQQATVLMHELGHNLGLRHGGFEDRNYKPNYYSVMNYLYNLKGLARNAKGAGPMQRWFAMRGTKSIALQDFVNSPLSEDYYIDYSNGSSSVLDGRALVESDLIGRGADAGIYADWNNNGVMDVGAYGVATALTSMPNEQDAEGAKPMQDHNDWANLHLPFGRNVVGTSTILSVPSQSKRVGTGRLDPLINDTQTAVQELPITKSAFR